MTIRINALGPFKSIRATRRLWCGRVPETDWHQISLNQQCYSLLGDFSANIVDAVGSLQQHTTSDILAKSKWPETKSSEERKHIDNLLHVSNFRGEETGNPVIIEQAGLGKTIGRKHARDEGSTLIRSFLIL
jgi:hypothetical protein